MAFTSDIESLPPQFLISHWGMLYNNGDQWDRDSIKNVLHALKQLDAPRVIPPGQKAQSEEPSSNHLLQKLATLSSAAPSSALLLLSPIMAKSPHISEVDS
jgi:hypothetical protein